MLSGVSKPSPFRDRGASPSALIRPPRSSSCWSTGPRCYSLGRAAARLAMDDAASAFPICWCGGPTGPVQDRWVPRGFHVVARGGCVLHILGEGTICLASSKVRMTPNTAQVYTRGRPTEGLTNGSATTGDLPHLGIDLSVAPRRCAVPSAPHTARAPSSPWPADWPWRMGDNRLHPSDRDGRVRSQGPGSLTAPPQRPCLVRAAGRCPGWGHAQRSGGIRG